MLKLRARYVIRVMTIIATVLVVFLCRHCTNQHVLSSMGKRSSGGLLDRIDHQRIKRLRIQESLVA